MDEFLRLCRRFGQLEDLVQAGGGNISVKVSDTLSIIKSSGIALSDVTRDKGYTVYDHAKLSTCLNAPLDTVVVVGPAPSLETYFHCFLAKYVVHLHPTTMLPMLCSSVVPAGTIPYHKPGLDLAVAIRAAYTPGQQVVFLQNHGVIFTADTIEDLMRVADETYEQLRMPRFVPLKLFWSLQDEFRDEYVYRVPPADTQIYLPILFANNVRNLTPDIALFLYGRIHIEDGFLFLHAPTKSACLATLEVLRSYCEVGSQCQKHLTEMQVADILHWPAEIKRKSMQ